MTKPTTLRKKPRLIGNHTFSPSTSITTGLLGSDFGGAPFGYRYVRKTEHTGAAYEIVDHIPRSDAGKVNRGVLAAERDDTAAARPADVSR